MAVYKALLRSHLDYSGVIYDESYKETLHQKFGSI